MKRNFLILLLCTCFLSISSTFAQTPTNFNFRFQVRVNGVNYGHYHLSTTHHGILQKVNPAQNDLPTLCPGDQITLKNECVYESSNHSFASGTPNFNAPTIGLTPSNGCSTSSYDIPILHLGDVCHSYPHPTNPYPCHEPTSPSYQQFTNWNYNSSITVTYHYTPGTYNYLAIDAGGTMNVIGKCGCQHRVAYLPLNFGEKPTLIESVSVCPNDLINLGLDPNCTYSNWSTPNPDGSTLSSTTSYTVDITNNISGCSITDDFTVQVRNPDAELSIPTHLCYYQNFQISMDDFYGLFYDNTSASQILVNNVLIAELDNTTSLPYTINGVTHGSGIVTIEYIYEKGGLTCSKIYELFISPEMVLNTQSAYAVCNGNFQSICATTSGIAQPATVYSWTEIGVATPVATGVCFTPTSYGDYYVTAQNKYGCETTNTFTVYNPGVGLSHLTDITFCSATEAAPSYIGWSNDPSGIVSYSFDWSYTDEDGTTVPISIRGVQQYQAPYLGSGTYTVVVNGGGCTETISITVTDLLEVYNNSALSLFSFTPLTGNQVSCQPNANNPAIISTWTVINQATGLPVPTSVDAYGIKFNYSLGVQYSVTLTRSTANHCQLYINQFEWLDGSGHNISSNNGGNSGRNNRSNMSNTGITTAIPLTINTFPNPTTGLVNIQLKDTETTETSIQVLNTLGQIILEQQVQNKTNIEIDLSQEISGIYILNIVNGKSQFTEKVIKE